MNLHENIKRADPRTRAADTYSAPMRPAAEVEVAEFIASLVNLVKPGRALELGTAWGHTSKVIGEALARNGFGELDTLDINNSRLVDARKRCKDLPVNIYHADYNTWEPVGRYDIVFFDSDLKNRDVEYRLMEPYINDHAVLLFHDAGIQHQGDSGSISRLPLQMVYLPCPRGLVISSQPERK